MLTEEEKLPLSLKQIVYLSLGLYVFAILLLGSLSFYDLARIGSRVSLIADFDQLTNVILEIRRFEKNYLLYLNEDDLTETRNYIREARGFIEHASAVKKIWDARLYQLRQTLDEYSHILNRVSSAKAAPRGDEVSVTEQLRDVGKQMVNLAEELSRGEKQAIREILTMLKLQLVVSVLCALFLGFVGIRVLFGNMFKTLDVIVDATRSIGSGKFSTLPEIGAQSETKRIINAFNRMVRELEHRQEQLVQAQKLSSLGTLTAGVAHQLNNPLNNISTSAQIALEELQEDPETLDREMQHKMLLNIEQESTRAKEIVQGLLDFSRERDFSPKQTPLARLLRKTMRLVSSQVPSGIEIKTDFPEDMVLVLDEQRMQEALLNLVINAIQAIPTDYGVITLRAGPMHDAAPYCAFISVQDNGVGIPKRLMERVFDPFFTTKEERVGTGLGLSIVYGIVERHGGSVRVFSEEGKGTTITMLLPCEPAAGQESTEASPVSANDSQ